MEANSLTVILSKCCQTKICQFITHRCFHFYFFNYQWLGTFLRVTVLFFVLFSTKWPVHYFCSFCNWFCFFLINLEEFLAYSRHLFCNIPNNFSKICHLVFVFIVLYEQMSYFDVIQLFIFCLIVCALKFCLKLLPHLQFSKIFISYF